MPARILMPVLVLLLSACGSKKSNPAPAPTNPNLPPPIDATGGTRTPYIPPPDQAYAPPVAPAVQDYGQRYLDPRVALNGMGRWIDIDGQPFFVPDFSQSGDHDGWEPYQNGYWSYDEDRDWTWNSSDRWGWMTDHYGVWRNHRTHGWIWAPFALRLDKSHYQPHCVTWFDEGEYVGWYPYYSGFDAHYRRFGQNHGFVDGYWDGYRSVLSLSANAFGFRLGITMVSRTDVTQPNIRRRMIRDRGIILRIAHLSHSHDRIRIGRVGRIPGGDRRRSHDFLQRWAPHQRAPVGRAREIDSRGGARILQPFFDRNGDGRPDRRRDDDRRRTDRRPDPTTRMQPMAPRQDESRRTPTQPTTKSPSLPNSVPAPVATSPAPAPSGTTVAPTTPPRRQQPSRRDGDRDRRDRGNDDDRRERSEDERRRERGSN